MADFESIADTLVSQHLNDAANQFRNERNAAQARGDMDAAHKADALERRALNGGYSDDAAAADAWGTAVATTDVGESLPDIGPPPDGEWTFSRPEVVDHQFAMMESAFGDLATDLKAEWGAGAGENLQFAHAAARQFEEQYPDIVSAIAARGGTNDPLVVEILAMLGRQWAETPGDPGSVRLFPGATETREFNMTDTDVEKFDDAIDEIRSKARQAFDAGNHAKADRLAAKEREMYARRYGVGEIIGPGAPPVGRGGREL